MNKNIITIPNIISSIRIKLVGIAAILLFSNNRTIATIIYLIAILTDFLDGYLARKLNQVSELGKILDPLADKLLIGSIMLVLYLQTQMPLWYLLVFAGCSLYNVLGALLIRKRITFVLPSVMVGKVAAVLMMATCMLNIIAPAFEYLLYCYIISALLLVISVARYTQIAISKLKK